MGIIKKSKDGEFISPNFYFLTEMCKGDNVLDKQEEQL